MILPSFRRCAAGVALFALSMAAMAGGGGSCAYKEAKLALVDGYVYRAPASLEDGKQEIRIALATIKLDTDKLASAPDVEGALREQVWDRDGGQLQLTLSEDGVTSVYAYIPPGQNISRSGTAFGELKLSRNDTKGVAGTFKLAAEAADEIACDVTFDLAYIAAKPKPVGKPIAAGGGEAGKVFLANVAAMQKGDVDAMLATVSKEQADQVRAHRKDPDFPAMLEMMKAFAPKTAKITGGEDFGDNAELLFEGTDSSGAKMTGTARMIKETGVWKVSKTSSQSGG